MTLLEALGYAITAGILLASAAPLLLDRASGTTCAILAVSGGTLLAGGILLGGMLGVFPEFTGLLAFGYAYGALTFCVGVMYLFGRSGRTQ